MFDTTRRFPQVGPIDVDPAQLRAPGEPLTATLERFNASLRQTPAPELEGLAWRSFGETAGEVRYLGAPVDEAGQEWLVCYIEAPTDRQQRRSAAIHRDAHPLRRSRAERSAGLRMRWPEVMTSQAHEPAWFVVDIVNAGEESWEPDPLDSPRPIGLLTAVGAAAGEVIFAWIGDRGAASL